MSYRKEKIEELIKRIISEAILKEINDPRIGFVTITGVTLNKDFSLAEVGVSVIGVARDIRKALEGLKSATGYIQKYVAQNIRLRYSPKLKFFLDSSVADGVKMVNFLENLPGVKPKD